MGMPHRGRLNVLCNLLHKPAGLLFGEMVQAVSEFHVGDVQYHQGESSTLSFPRQVRKHPFRAALCVLYGRRPCGCWRHTPWCIFDYMESQRDCVMLRRRSFEVRMLKNG